MKDTVIAGSLRATDTLYSTTAQFSILRAPTSSGGTTFGPGSANNLLKSNGTSVYWTTLAASDIPTISITDKTSGTLSVVRGGTGATTAENARSNLGLGSIATYDAATSGTTDTWGLVPVIGDSNGVMEVGKYIDFHTTDGNTANYDVRITASTSGLTISGTTIGTFSGNLIGNAATSTKATKDADGNTISSTYLKLSGGTMTGNLSFKKTDSSMSIINFLDKNNVSRAQIRGYSPTSSELLPDQSGIYFVPAIDFLFKSYDSSTGELIDNACIYSFPSVEANLTTNQAYKILTTKAPVTVEQGGTGVTAIANIQAGKDGDGNVISSTYLKLSRTRLYTGPTEVVSTNTLSDDLQNYKLLKITFITNQEYKNIWLDTAEDFRFNKYYIETACGGPNWGSSSSFYITQCDVMFTDGTTFTTNSNYNNANYILRVHTIDGYK